MTCVSVCVSSYLWMPFMRLKHGPLLKGVLYCMLDWPLHFESYQVNGFFLRFNSGSQNCKTQDIRDDMTWICCLFCVSPPCKIPNPSIQKLAIWNSPSFLKKPLGGVHQPPLSRHQRVHQQLGVLLGWNQSKWRSSKTWKSAVRCPAEMMKTYGLCRIDVVGLQFDRFVLLLWQLRNFITDTRRDGILVCKESEKFLRGFP